MRIKKLILIGFGKFKNKTIELEKGINVIYGENEAGKSTIHKFIEGMLFGFFKAYSKRKIYTSDYEKYLPWDSNEYKGILIYEHKGINYRIERTFLKQQEKVKIFDDDTGEDLTHLFDYNKKTKLPEPASKDLGLNVTLYNNTINIFESNRKSSNDLAKEIKDKMVHMSNSKIDSISVKNVIEYLDKKLNDIGTLNKSKTPYGKLINKLNLLHEEKRQAEINENMIKEIQIEIKNINRNKNELEQRIKDIDNKLDLYDKYIVQTQLKDIEKVKKEIEDIDKYINERDKLKDYSIEQIDQAITNIKLKNKYIEDRNRTLEEIKKVKEKISLCGNVGLNEIEKINQEIQKVDIKEEVNKKTLFEESYTNLKKLLTKLNVGIILSNIFSGLFILFDLCGLMVNHMALLLLILSVPASILFIIKRSKSINKLKYLRSLIKSNNEAINNKQEKYRKLLRYREKFYIQANNNMIIEEYKKSLNGLLLELKRIDDEINKLIECDKELNSFDYGDLKILKQEISDYRECIQKKNIKQQLLDKLCKKDNIDLYSQVKNISDTLEENIKIIKNIDKQHLIKDKNILKDTIRQIELNFSRLNEKQKLLLQKERSVVDILQEISVVENTKLKYDEDIEALKLAKKTINEISSNIQHEFAPSLNKKVSKIFSKITDGKYKDIRVSKDMDVKVIDPNTHQLLNLDKLSYGTIDQVYFAFRLALVELLKNKDAQYPLLLDDTFVHYDDLRLNQILKLLNALKEDKQIILFSCHQRETRILNSINCRFNYQELKIMSK